MKTVTIQDAKTNLSEYIANAKNGEKIYIGAFGKAEVVLTKIDKPTADPTKRDFSIGKGKILEKPESFSKATDKEIADLLLADI